MDIRSARISRHRSIPPVANSGRFEPCSRDAATPSLTCNQTTGNPPNRFPLQRPEIPFSVPLKDLADQAVLGLNPTVGVDKQHVKFLREALAHVRFTRPHRTNEDDG